MITLVATQVMLGEAFELLTAVLTAHLSGLSKPPLPSTCNPTPRVLLCLWTPRKSCFSDRPPDAIATFAVSLVSGITMTTHSW